VSRFPVRNLLVLGGISLACAGLAVRAIHLQLLQAEYLQEQGNSRYLRTVKDVPARGMILDRNGEPLAVSTPVESLWADPALLAEATTQWPVLARRLEMSEHELRELLRQHRGKEFMYLKRQVAPEYANGVLALKVPGVSSMREYRRYYPAGDAAGHVVGFTNVDDAGQEGLELAYDHWLNGTPGRKRVLKDRLGNIVESVESVTLPQRGKDLVISIDRRIQYLAYRELKQTVAAHGAKGGTAIIMDVRTGEILAMVNQPGFNPNNRTTLDSRLFRNRAVTDLFEPGSTVKPFTIAAALSSGKYSPRSLVNTTPGLVRVGSKTIHDEHNYGWLSVTRVIEKSSNVGAAKIALDLGREPLWRMMSSVGLGQSVGIGLPSEASGVLRAPNTWAPVDNATLAYGYGISVSTLQLARAYGVLASDGLLMTPTLLLQHQLVAGKQVLDAALAKQIRHMLERAVGAEGTGRAADLPFYRVAGKTGTVHKLINGAYADDRYLSLFAGFAPVTDPRLVMVVTVDDPTRGGYFGGQIAAPVFHHVMAGALRLMNIAPDEPEGPTRQIVRRAVGGVT
jgi:cell division protein FtsI (penicillin-binding protein 3)